MILRPGQAAIWFLFLGTDLLFRPKQGECRRNHQETHRHLETDAGVFLKWAWPKRRGDAALLLVTRAGQSSSHDGRVELELETTGPAFIGSPPISVTRANGPSWRQMGSGRGGGNCLTISNRPGTASPVKGKLQQHLTPLPEALLLAVPMLLGAACAAIQRDTEQMLVAAGFHMRPTDTTGCRRIFGRYRRIGS